MPNEMPTISKVKAVGPSAIEVTWKGGETDRIELAGWIGTGDDVLAPLRDPAAHPGVPPWFSPPAFAGEPFIAHHGTSRKDTTRHAAGVAGAVIFHRPTPGSQYRLGPTWRPTGHVGHTSEMPMLSAFPALHWRGLAPSERAIFFGAFPRHQHEVTSS